MLIFRALIIAFTLLTSSGLLADQVLRPFTHEEIWLAKRLGEPVVSPDGQSIVLSVTEPSYEEDGDVSDLWLLDVSGQKAPRRLTSTKAGESGLAWSPDGNTLAFTSKRDGEEINQVYLLDMTGPGEASVLSNLSTGAANPVWSPDGKHIAFESRVYPDTADDAANKAEKEAREASKTNVSVYETFPVRQWDRWRDDLQTHLFVQAIGADEPARDLLAGSELVASAGFQGMPSLSGDSLKAAWTPDGKALLISATGNLDDAAHARVFYHLYRIPADGGTVEPVSTGNDWNCHTAIFSKDGDSVYCRFSAVNEHVYNLPRVARFNWNGLSIEGPPDIVSQSLDRPVTGLALGNPNQVFVTATDAGRVRIYSLSANGSEPQILDPDSRGVYAGLQRAGSSLVARWESSAHPAEIVRIDPDTGVHTSISGFNTDRGPEIVDRPQFREFWFTSSKGRRVHSWVTLPSGFDANRKYPLVSLIHGGPFSSSLDSNHVRWSAHLLASPGYIVLQTDYTGSVGYGETFSRNIQNDPLKTPGEEIIEAANEAIRLYDFIDEERQAAAGASYGGHLVNWLQATTSHYKALVGHAGLVDLEGQYSSSDTIYNREIMNGGPAWGDSPVWEEQSPSTFANRFATPILLTIGEKDFRVPVNQTIAAWSYVQRMQVPGRLLVFHDANHWIMKGEEAKFYWQEVHNWLAKYLSE